MAKKKILHLIVGLDTGGAEIMLLNLLKKTDRERFAPVVVSLMDEGTLGGRIKALDVPVHTVGMQRGRMPVLRLGTLWRLLRREKPDLIQGWMYHANFLAMMLAPLAERPPIIWGLHHTVLDARKDKISTIRIAKLCAFLSRYTKAIVACSNATLNLHAGLGYDREKMVMIPNGFDLEQFSPDPEARASLRKELGLSPGVLLIGLIARFDPQKDHENFFRAARLLLDSVPEDYKGLIHFVLCGREIEDRNPQIARWMQLYNLGAQVHLLGLREDIPRITAALDVAASSSSGEAFPMTVGEAMACGVPCIVTDVGDSAGIVGEAGRVVPPESSEAFAQALAELVKMPLEMRNELGLKGRERVTRHFALDIIAGRYEDLYLQI